MNALTNPMLAEVSGLPQQRSLYPPKEFVKVAEFSFLTESSLRHLIFNSQPRYSASGEVIPGNGLVEAGAIIRIGRKVLIDAVKFREWMMSKRETVPNP